MVSKSIITNLTTIYHKKYRLQNTQHDKAAPTPAVVSHGAKAQSMHPSSSHLHLSPPFPFSTPIPHSRQPCIGIIFRFSHSITSHIHSPTQPSTQTRRPSLRYVSSRPKNRRGDGRCPLWNRQRGHRFVNWRTLSRHGISRHCSKNRSISECRRRYNEPI
jgi:hypothetical protein